MVYEHALRCLCKLCGSLLNWECPKDISYTETECCGLHYRLQPRTVIVHVEDVSSRPILPQMDGSNYSDPSFQFTPDQFVGESANIVETAVGGLSNAQRSLGKTTDQRVTEPRTTILRAKTRRCGVCRKTGHTRKTCPDA